MKPIGINGFGRIGRLALRILLTYFPDSPINLINTSGSMDAEGWKQLFIYDTAYGKFEKPVEVLAPSNENEIGKLKIENREIALTAKRNPEEIPWKNYGVEIVLESTGVFQKKEDAGKHLLSGAKQVIISAPPKGSDIPLIVIPINTNDGKNQPIISNGSCTTYSAVPVVYPIEQEFGIEKATLTTVHAITSDQNLLDGSHHSDIRRARAATGNIIPTSSGAADSVIAIIPSLTGKFEAASLRVPVLTGSLSDITFLLKKPISVQEANAVLTRYSQEMLKGILTVTSDPIVSSDIIGNNHSAVVDASLTTVIDGNLLKIFSWYDNEWSYAMRLIELARLL
jgi:glyceraldehyde 3-phosphate dehydrogenase